jgi:EAL domain-containing protein (putative c-di-GMP-specific phosphodiesterase class I)/ActR/RegA family two-component response regulator
MPLARDASNVHFLGEHAVGANLSADSEGGANAAPTSEAFIIEDDRALAEVFQQVLERRGLSTRTFAGRAELEAVPASQWAHLIILDLSLGESDAIEVIGLLARRNHNGAVALMSGRGEEILGQVHKIGLRHGLTMLAPLAKPIRPEQIDALVRYVKSIGEQRPRFDLATALDEGWIDFWYQPKIDLATQTEVGLEALARLSHPSEGIFSPVDFLPQRRNAAMDRLTEVAVTTACRDWSTLRAGRFAGRMAINAPISALASPEFIALVREASPRHPEWQGLTVEVTEAELVRDMAFAFELAVQLRLCNVDLSIDDFGKGYSSLAQVRALPFAEIKLDRSFVDGVSREPKLAAICELSVGLAHRFGKRAVAEGVESPADLTALLGMGCDIGQGFLFGRPQPLTWYAARGHERQPPASA